MKNSSAKKNSNQVFSIPKSLINTNKFLQRISLKLSAKFLSRIFETPPKFKTPERELMFRKSAQSQKLSIPSIQKEVTVYSYGFSKKKVLLLHGWSGRGSQLYHLADKILENRMMVISVDAPAHGLSSGKTTNMLEYLETIKTLDQKFGPFHAAVGHSWGGMSLLNAMARDFKVEKAVSIGADDKISEVIGSFVQKFEGKPGVVPIILNHYSKLFKVEIDEFDANKAAKKIETPTLVVHDTEDLFVPVSSAYTIRQNLENGALLITNQLGHHKIFKDAGVIDKVVKFIQ